MSSQGAEANQKEKLTGSAMATFMPHLLVQLVALLAASGGLILLAVPGKSLQVGMQVVQSAFVVMGITALSILFWWLFELCLFYLENGGNGSDFYFDLHSAVLSLVPELFWVGLVGEGLRQFFPLLRKAALIKYFTT